MKAQSDLNLFAHILFFYPIAPPTPWEIMHAESWPLKPHLDMHMYAAVAPLQNSLPYRGGPCA